MRICADMGLPHSAFQAWDEDDRLKRIAFELDKGGRCGACHQRFADWSEPDGRMKEHPPFKWGGQICWSCNEIATIREAVEERAKASQSDDEAKVTRIVARPT